MIICGQSGSTRSLKAIYMYFWFVATCSFVMIQKRDSPYCIEQGPPYMQAYCKLPEAPLFCHLLPHLNALSTSKSHHSELHDWPHQDCIWQMKQLEPLVTFLKAAVVCSSATEIHRYLCYNFSFSQHYLGLHLPLPFFFFFSPFLPLKR